MKKIRALKDETRYRYVRKGDVFKVHRVVRGQHFYFHDGREHWLALGTQCELVQEDSWSYNLEEEYFFKGEERLHKATFDKMLKLMNALEEI